MGRFLEWLVLSVLAKLFPGRYRIIPGLHGKPLLRQFKITGWAYLQSFVNAEGRDLFHRHRWKSMVSFVLSGYLQEERYPGCGDFLFMKAHKAPSVYTMDDTVIHRLDYVAPRTWTLFLMFDDQKNWGYFRRPAVPPEYIPWDKAIPEEKRVKSL